MTRQSMIILALALGGGGGAFLLGRTAGHEGGPVQVRPADDEPCCDQDDLCHYLRLSPSQQGQVCQADPQFAREAQDLRRALEQQRADLVAMLDDPAHTDEAILAQVDRVAATHTALERRVARHLLAIRKLLTPQQARQFMGLAADSVRETSRGQYRRGYGHAQTSPANPQDGRSQHRNRRGVQGLP